MSVLVGKQAPDFTVPAVLGNGEIVDSFTFSQATQGKYAIVFFYPLDFTFVCPSELIALDHRMDEFTKRNVEVVAVSIDSHFTHNAWRNTPVNQGGIGPVKYTMAADLSHAIVNAYDVAVEGPGIAYRGA
ncbi:MAG TPA: alkyl hydroperoxide reductase, partial [Methylococcaceae bacterium]|nr:alkyl hydroperoxide reductase [Methylococcaceae bacterium]